MIKSKQWHLFVATLQSSCSENIRKKIFLEESLFSKNSAYDCNFSKLEPSTSDLLAVFWDFPEYWIFKTLISNFFWPKTKVYVK